MSNSKISMFGVSASGKTCFLYAMAQVVGRGVRAGQNFLQLISNRASQQMKLNDGFMQLARGRWPQTTDRTETYDFKVNVQLDDSFKELIDSLEIQDYRGGLLQTTSEFDEKEFNDLLQSFRGSTAIMFIVDGQTLIDALDEHDKDFSHRGQANVLKRFQAQSQIRFVENIFLEYKRLSDEIPPILIAISKGDIFASDFEKRNAVKMLKESLPSIFAVGSDLTTGITVMALGENLGTDADGNIMGTLSLSTAYNIHIPVIFAVYAELCQRYEVSENDEERARIIRYLSFLRNIYAGRLMLYIDGRTTSKEDEL